MEKLVEDINLKEEENEILGRQFKTLEGAMIEGQKLSIKEMDTFANINLKPAAAVSHIPLV